MIVFVAFLICLGYGFDRFYLGGGEFFFPVGTIAAFGVGSISAVSSYYSGDRAVLISTGAVPVDQLLSRRKVKRAGSRFASSTMSSKK